MDKICEKKSYSYELFDELKWTKEQNIGSSSSTVAESIPRDREVMGLNPTKCWAFFFSSLPDQ